MNFVEDFKYRHIIYHWKSFFTTNIDLRLLYQNKTPFGSDQLSKIRQYARKCVLSIRVVSSRTDGTITTRRPKGFDWYLLACKIGQRTARNVGEPQPSHAQPTVANDSDWGVGKPCPTVSLCSAPFGLAHAP